MNATDRRSRLLGPLDPTNGRGLEIGALSTPLIRKQDSDVLYVDYADTEHLRKNQFSQTVHPEDIVEVDIVWGEKPLLECVGETVDYVVAIHVIEHVPDVIGWLLEVHDVLKPYGVVCLGIPDRRFTFDILRGESTVGEMVQAYLERRRHPTPAQKFDFTSSWRNVDALEAWAGRISVEHLHPIGTDHVEVAFAQAQEVHETGAYMDSHCWAFTPLGFVDAARTLSRLGLFPFEVTLQDTLWGEFEFIVHLRRSDDAVRIKDSINAAADAITDKSTTQLERRLMEDLTSARDSLNALREECKNLRSQLADMQRSRSWKMTASWRPLRGFLKEPLINHWMMAQCCP